MKNMEKYLKKDVDVEELKKDFFDYLVSDGVYGCNSKNIVQKWEDFLNMPVTPTLTEDEKVILSCIDGNFYKIGKADNGDLYLVKRLDTAYSEIENFEFFKWDLFQSIKERRRI